MPSTSRTARAASAASTAPVPTVARFSEPDLRRAARINYAELRAALGDPELDPELLERALTHRSYAYENGGLPTNERLEFLGDSVLGVVVTETLYLMHPDLSEGRLAKLRAAVVNARALAGVARTIDLGDQVKLGRGEEATGGRDKASILSDTVEAVIGAVHLSGGGITTSAEVVHLLFDPLIEAASAIGAGLDWKTSLQELTAEHRSRRPRVRHRGRRPRPHEDLHRAGARRRAPARQRRRPVEEGGRAGRGRDGVRRARADARRPRPGCEPRAVADAAADAAD